MISTPVSYLRRMPRKVASFDLSSEALSTAEVGGAAIDASVEVDEGTEAAGDSCVAEEPDEVVVIVAQYFERS
jgi:hypothetical protein